jgi:hypothetical protein
MRVQVILYIILTHINKLGFTVTNTLTNAKLPTWFWVIAILGLAWNIFGVFQFLSTANGTIESLVRNGLSSEQAKLYMSLPGWMTASFAIGVFGGVIGSILLLMRKKLSVSVFLLSLAGYIVLYIGDITQGVFKVFGTPQVVILTSVVLIAAGLLWLARRFTTSGHLN